MPDPEHFYALSHVTLQQVLRINATVISLLMEESEIYRVNQGVQEFSMHAFLYCDEGTMMSAA